MESQCKVKIWTGRALSGLAVLPFLFSIWMKFSGAEAMMQGFEHLGWPTTVAVRLGLLESACVVIYLIPATSVLGAILMTGYVGGAIATHVRIGEPPILQAVLGVLIWAGLYLRERRLTRLLPIVSAPQGNSPPS